VLRLPRSIENTKPGRVFYLCSFEPSRERSRRDCLIEHLLLTRREYVVLSHFREDLYTSEGEFQADPADEKPIRRRGRILAVCLPLALIGGGSAFLWHYYGGTITVSATSKTDTISQLTVTLEGLQRSQQGIAADVRRNQEMLQAQQADIKRLSEEIAQLAAKLDLLQGIAREAKAAAPSVHKPPPNKPASKPVVHEPASQATVSLAPDEKQ